MDTPLYWLQYWLNKVKKVMIFSPTYTPPLKSHVKEIAPLSRMMLNPSKNQCPIIEASVVLSYACATSGYEWIRLYEIG
ncbi:MAG: hypothetical protein ACO3YZ_08055, partial [Candidatus Nanopelagicaceae bacterium]